LESKIKVKIKIKSRIKKLADKLRGDALVNGSAAGERPDAKDVVCNRAARNPGPAPA
jgi:hypothetical protein